MRLIDLRALPAAYVELPARRWAALPVMLAGSFMVVLDFFIVNVAIPSIQVDLHASTEAIEWIVAGYGLAYAALLIIGGRLGDLFGRRRVFACGLSGFTLASAACGFAPSATSLIIARVAQGAGAALLAPQVLAILNATYSGADRVRAFAAYGMVLGLASASGQLIGGSLIAAGVMGLGWRACFLVNLPVGIAALIAARWFVPESRSPQGGRMDATGAMLLGLGLTAMLAPLIEGRGLGWPAWTGFSFSISIAALTGFAWRQRRLAVRRGAPLVDPALLQLSAFRLGLVAVFALFGGVASLFFVLALYLQQGRGLPPLASGLVFTAMALAFSASSLAAKRIERRMKVPGLLIGASVMALGLLALRLTVGWIGTGGPVLALAPALALDGMGMGLLMAPLAAASLSAVPRQHSGAAAGVLAAVQQLGNALGVGAIGLVFFARTGGDTGGASYGVAFSASLDCLLVLAIVLAILVWRLLRRPATGE